MRDRRRGVFDLEVFFVEIGWRGEDVTQERQLPGHASLNVPRFV